MAKDPFPYRDIPVWDETYLRYKGLFDFDGLYAGVVDWAKNYNYFFHEKVYKHKVPSAKGAEQELRWSLTQKVDEYVIYEFILEFHIWDMKEVKVNVGGRQKSLSSGRIEIKVAPLLHTDWQKKFDEKVWWQRLLGKLYFKVMITDIEVFHIDTLRYRHNNILAHIRKLLDMESKTHVYKEYLGEN